MSYINRKENDFALTSVTVSGRFSNCYPQMNFDATSISFGYNTTTNKYFCLVPPPYHIPPLYIYSDTFNFHCELRAGTNIQELVDVDTNDGSHTGTTDFRTLLHCDLPRTECAISYPTTGGGILYVNGTNTGVSFNWNTKFTYFYINVTPKSEKTTCSASMNIVSQSWDLPKCSSYYKWSTSSFSGYANTQASGNNVSCSFSRTEKNGYLSTQPLLSFGATMNSTTTPTYYSYNIDGSNLNNTSQLKFTCDELANKNPNFWTGLSSPTFNYKGETWTATIWGGAISGTEGRTTITENPTCTSGNNWEFSGNDSIPPTDIGNVTCLNPQLINDYTQTQSDTRGGQEPQEVRNNIFKIMPKFNSYGSGLLSMQSQTITNNNWQYHNCELQNGKVVATGENAYIYQDYTRGKYTNEIDPTNILGGDQYKEYRQRHFTHFRYMVSTFQKTEGGQSDFYNPDIKLIYKPISDYTSGHTWTAKFNSAIGYYDLLDCNLANTSSQDELTNLIEPEYMYLAFEGATEEPEKNVTFIVEQPLTAFGYLPNVVGQIQIPIPQNCEVTLGTLSSYYAPNLNQVSEPVDSLGAWESLDHLIEYTDGGQNFTAKPSGKLYIHSYTEPTFTINDVNVTNNWTTLNNVTNVNVVMVHEGVTSTVSKTFSENVIIKFKTYHIDNDPYPDEYGIEWYFIKKDNDEEYEEVDGIWYRKRYKDTGYNIMAGSEFQEPLHFGLHQPKPRDTQSESDVTRDLYQNRFLVVDINGARSFEIPEVRKDVLHGSYSDQISFHPVTLGQCKTNYNNPGDRFVFFRDDLNEITLSVYDSSPINNNYPINDMFFGSGAYINWLQVFESKIEVPGDTNYWHKNIKIVPRFDTLSGSELYRFINNGNTTLKCRGDFGAYFSGTNKVDTTGNIVDNSEYDNDVSLNFDTHKYYTSHFHGTDAEINLCSNVKKRTIEKVVDCVKYWWSVGISVGIGFIWRNSQGNILRNSQNKILRGHGYDNNP